MAPWPDRGNEPKAPDKNSESANNAAKSDSRTQVRNSAVTDSDIPDPAVQEPKLATSKMVQDVNSQKAAQDSPNTSKSEKDGQSSKRGQRVVDTLDEDGLKSLLEEAITYKSPKDKDTKSALFQNLLIEAEKKDDSDQTDDDSGRNQYQASGSGRTQLSRTRKRLNRRDTDRQRGGGSLQNLAWHGRLANRVSVSARQREGGSLPTNVNQSCADDAASASHHRDDALCNYTSRATLHVSPVETPVSLALSTTSKVTSVVNGVEHTPLQLHSSYNAVKSVVGCETALKSGTSSENPTQHVSTCFLPISPQQPTSGLRDTDLRQYATYVKETGGELKIKSFDENGNALATTNRVETSTNDRKAKRKKKNYRNIMNAENIEGHRWDEDIDSLMKYINSGSTEECKSHKTRQSNTSVALMKGARAPVSKMKSKEEEGRKRKTKETKLHKSNSLEEISKTKLEDLTSPSEKKNEETTTRIKPKKQVTLDDAQLEANCWQTETLTQSVSIEKIVIDKDKKKLEKKQESFSDLQDAEFHLVKKKQRKKKRQVTNYGRQGSSKGSNSGYYGNQGFPSHYRRSAQAIQESVQQRRKSASSVPPSDKSDSSDLDSVHSLPVSSTTPKPTVGKTSTSGGSTPQASYADITRSMITPPRAPCIKTIIGLRSSGIDDDHRVMSPPPAPPPPPPPPPPPTPPPPPPPPSKTLSAPLRKDAMTDTDSDKILLPVEEYPPLARKHASSDYFVEFTLKRNRATRETDVSVEETVVLKSVQNKKDFVDKLENDYKREATTGSKQVAADTSGSVAGKRPAVILLNRSGRSSPQQALDVTFGFDINQELLAESEHVTKEPYDHAKTVQYVKSEWEAVMELFNSNDPSQPQVQYYKPE